MRRVLLISFGITILPRSSTLRTILVAFLSISSSRKCRITVLLFVNIRELCLQKSFVCEKTLTSVKTESRLSLQVKKKIIDVLPKEQTMALVETYKTDALY